MITLIQKLVIIWEKRKFLNLLKMETAFLEHENQEVLREDEKGLRAELAELGNIKNPREEIKRQIMDLDGRINNIARIKNMIEGGKIKRSELERQLEFYQKNLWN